MDSDTARSVGLGIVVATIAVASFVLGIVFGAKMEQEWNKQYGVERGR